MSDTKRIVTVAPEDLFDKDNGSFVNLRHPRHGDAALFYMRNNFSLWEVQRYKEKYRSWFIGNFVKSDGSLYFITPFDPLFVAIHYLKQKNRFSTLDTVLEDSEFPEVKQLIDSDRLMKSIDLISDVKSSSGFKAYRYSESKTLQWLERRFSKVEKALRDNDISCCMEGISQASSWRSDETSTPEAIRQYALGIISEYLSDDLENKLTDHLGIKTEAPKENISGVKENGVKENGVKDGVKEEGDTSNENCVSENGAPSAKKRKSVAPVHDYEQTLRQLVDVKKETSERGAKPKLKKQPGMQSITNFFKKS